MATTTKIDLYKLHKDEYAAPKKPTVVGIGKASYLAIAGRGGPGDPEFQRKLGALYGVAYTVKMTRKFSGKQDYVVCKLEAEYWLDDDNADFDSVPKDQWCWTVMIRTPDFVKKSEIVRAVEALDSKGKGDGARDVALERRGGGRAVQMLHLGPYEREPETIAQMKEFAENERLEIFGRHHEIYISDPRRVPPERLKTILRLPVRRKR